jgi:E3 ubiquitin-protein ligase RNF115/126
MSRLFCHSCVSTTTYLSGMPVSSGETYLCPNCGSNLVEFIDTETQSNEIHEWYPNRNLAGVRQNIQTSSLSNLLQQEIALAQRAAAYSNAAFFVPGSDGNIRDLMHRLLMQHQPNAVPTPMEVVRSLNSSSNGLTATNVASEEPCAICLESMKEDAGEDRLLCLRQLPCSHWFHDTCILPWLEQSQTCPTCRGNVVGLGFQN